jgi:hypothetical protein
VFSLAAQPLRDVHFNPGIRGGSMRDSVSPAFVWGLLIIGLMILGIACINFVNLTLGMSVTRSGEVAVRKVLGAGRGQLLGQFWSEALVVVGLAVALGLLWTRLALPEYNAFFGIGLSLSDLSLAWALALIVVFAGLVGGGYPALVTARFQPVKILKKETVLSKPGRLRNGLIVIQFAISVLLIACTLIIGLQIRYLRAKPLGFNRSEVISIPVGNSAEAGTLIDRLRQRLNGHSAVHSISGAQINIGLGNDGSSYRSVVGMNQDGRQVATHWSPVDYDFLQTLDIALVAGRDFSRSHAADSTGAVIINETFARTLGYADPVGKFLQTDPQRQIIGVVGDYHFQSLAQAIEPLSLVLEPQRRFNYVLVRVANGDLPGTMALLERTWREVAPQAGAWNASFLDENTDRQYQQEARMAAMFRIAAGLAILLSCMGLFAIAVLTIAQRTKEIGIRKALGASSAHITALLARDFLLLVGFGFLIAAPLAWYAMRSWLADFAYRIDLSPWIFLVAGLAAAAVALLTIAVQTVRAALTNPVESLRSE